MYLINILFERGIMPELKIYLLKQDRLFRKPRRSGFKVTASSPYSYSSRGYATSGIPQSPPRKDGVGTVHL